MNCLNAGVSIWLTLVTISNRAFLCVLCFVFSVLAKKLQRSVEFAPFINSHRTLKGMSPPFDAREENRIVLKNLERVFLGV